MLYFASHISYIITQNNAATVTHNFATVIMYAIIFPVCIYFLALYVETLSQNQI